MGKIKIRMTNGIEDEKNVISAFKVSNESYAILDSGSMGSMGLPIILVSKLVGDKLTKILDQNEWQKAKEYLKMIISGSQMEYIVVPSFMNSDEVYFTQLTLPQASFATISNNYKPLPGSDAGPKLTFVPNIEITPISSTSSPAPTAAPVVPPVVPVVPTIQNPQETAPVVEPVSSVAPEIAPVQPVVAPINLAPAVAVPEINPISEPIISQAPQHIAQSQVFSSVGPTNTAMPIDPTQIPNVEVVPVAPITPVVPVEVPIVQTYASEPILNNINNEDKYKDMKETFMKSCENMFDALVKQFEDKN